MQLPLVDRGAIASQRGSRRNALVASARLTQRRAEAREVEEYLASLRPAVDEPLPSGAGARGSGAAGIGRAV